MRNRMIGTLSIVLGFGALLGSTTTRLPLTLKPESRLWVEGTSSTRDWKCAAGTFDATVEVAGPEAVRAVVAGEKSVRSVQLDVQTARMDCKNGTMNEHMLKALKAKDNPVISFRLATYELAKAGEAAQGTLAGFLKIGGVERPVTLIVDLKDSGDGVLHVTGTHEVNMRDFDLKPPSLMLGMIKVGEKVKVSFDLLLTS